MVITPPDKTGFRVWSHRSPVVEWKDGALGVFSEKYVQEWENRIKDLHMNIQEDSNRIDKIYDQLTESDLISIAQKYDAKYIIVRSPRPLSYPLLYQNSRYLLYHLTN